MTTDRSAVRGAGNTLLNTLTGIAWLRPAGRPRPASAQEYELVPPAQSPSGQPPSAQLGAPDMIPAGRGISMRAQIDVLFTPPGTDTPILIQRSFETGAASVNISSQYVFDVLNEAVLAGVDQALAGGAQTGRISVVAVCYSYGVDGEGVRSLAPMGVFINTTDLNVTADGNAALHSNFRVIPPRALGWRLDSSRPRSSRWCRRSRTSSTSPS